MNQQELTTTRKINDLGEHLRQLRGEIEVANAQLNSLKSEYVEINKAIESRIQNVQEEEKFIGEKLAHLTDKELHLQHKESNLVSREFNFLKEQSEFESYKNGKEVELINLEREFASNLTNAKEQLIVLEKDIKNATEALESLRLEKNKEMSNISSSIEKLNLEHSVALQSLLGIEDTITKEENNLRELRKEINTANNEAQIAGEKIKVAHEGLILREMEIDKKYRNYLTLKERLTKLFNKLYPEQNINNIL